MRRALSLSVLGLMTFFGVATAAEWTEKEVDRKGDAFVTIRLPPHNTF
jgi:hypothetical protein